MKTYCFDFDGTIADTLPLIVKSADFLLKKENEKEISGEVLRKIREEGIGETLKGLDIPLYRLFFLYLRIKRKMGEEIADAKPYEGVEEALRELRKKKYVLGILTSNSKENVLKFLEHNNLQFFDFIETSGTPRKEKSIKKLKRKGGIFVYIGDEARDISAGRKAGVKTVAAAWGLSSRRALLKERPDVLIERPSELLNLPF